MSLLDWLVLGATLAGITAYGIWKTRGPASSEAYLRGDQTLRWPTIGLSVMATQASAITFLSTPGQAYEDGMRFVQFYFGLPLAMILICAVFVPIYHRLKVYTAYEYLEHRFDARVRYVGAMLFLIQRGLAAGITIYAPSIIFSTLLGWSLQMTNLIMGLLVILYTVSGGTRAVSQTQRHQMVVMLAGIGLAFVLALNALPAGVSLRDAAELAGALGRMNVVSWEIDPNSRYNVWSGVTGGFFLALAYFGTDQSQVQRYLSGKSVAEIRLGLLFNGALKIPMQFAILAVGVLIFVLYVFVPPPAFFNTAALRDVPPNAELDVRYAEAFERQRSAATAFLASDDATTRAHLTSAAKDLAAVRRDVKAYVSATRPGTETKDADFVFLHFVMSYVPVGLIGLLIAVIMCAAMSSTASELSALGATTTMDLYTRLWRAPRSDRHKLRASQLFTVMWGLLALAFASFASLIDNLIEAVNILGSIFYGTVLGLFVVAFFVRFVRAGAVLAGAAVAQTTVIALYFFSELGFLWFNVVGCALVVVVSMLVQGAARLSPPAR